MEALKTAVAGILDALRDILARALEALESWSRTLAEARIRTESRDRSIVQRRACWAFRHPNGAPVTPPTQHYRRVPYRD